LLADRGPLRLPAVDLLERLRSGVRRAGNSTIVQLVLDQAAILRGSEQALSRHIFNCVYSTDGLFIDL